jgi:hypothetical protein
MSLPVNEFQGVVHVVREVCVHCNQSVQFDFIYMLIWRQCELLFLSLQFDADN